MAQVGKWAFIVGLVIAVVAGIGFPQPWFFWLLAVLGLIVGFLNVTSGETQRFLLAAIGLMLSATALRVIPYIGDKITSTLDYVVAFIAAALLVVALKALFETARD